MSKVFYIFRHGQSTYNLQKRTQGQTNNSVLTDLGKEQAKLVGEKLQDKSIEIILCSPLTRARQTAELANLSLNLPILIDERFNEVNVGEIEGMLHQDILAKFGEKYEQWRSLNPNISNVRFKGGESKAEVRERVFRGLDDYAENSKYHNIAISSHGIMLNQVLIALGHQCRPIANGSILKLIYENKIWKYDGFI